MTQKSNIILHGDVINKLKTLDDNSIDCVVTSPPYWGLRDYGNDKQIGLEQTPQEYVDKMVEIFREVKRVLKDDGTLWLNIGDSYKPAGKGSTKAGLNERYFGKKFNSDKQSAQENHLDRSSFKADVKEKELVGIPWRVAFSLQADGWYLRQDIIWAKPNPMPESVKDRCTKSHEYIFLLSKSPKYYYDSNAIREDQSPNTIKDLNSRKIMNNKGTHGGTRTDLARDRKDYVPADGKRNKRDVWTIATKPFRGAHFAVMPEALVEPCILAGSRKGGIVLDPFFGSGTVGVVALKHDRKYIGIEINKDYIKIAKKRIKQIKEQ